MPTIFRWKGYRVHFYSHEGSEPPHVHVRKAEDQCKFWLEPVSMAYNDGMKTSELHEIEEMIREHLEEFLRAWHEYFRQ